MSLINNDIGGIISKIKSHSRDIFGEVDQAYFDYNEICKTRINVFLNEFFFNIRSQNWNKLPITQKFTTMDHFP
jgi:hypothetical protein